MITLPKLSARASAGLSIDLTCLGECMMYCWPLLLVVYRLNTLEKGEEMNGARGLFRKRMDKYVRMDYW